ncbi:hypothetical protein DFH06DRAFT_283669 [Mycena polygramma]|nr:hypothetical protein DFH06DRAFT_283669 [Mycena polygramma]
MNNERNLFAERVIDEEAQDVRHGDEVLPDERTERTLPRPSTRGQGVVRHGAGVAISPISGCWTWMRRTPAFESVLEENVVTPITPHSCDTLGPSSLTPHADPNAADARDQNTAASARLFSSGALPSPPLAHTPGPRAVSRTSPSSHLAFLVPKPRTRSPSRIRVSAAPCQEHRPARLLAPRANHPPTLTPPVSSSSSPCGESIVPPASASVPTPPVSVATEVHVAPGAEASRAPCASLLALPAPLPYNSHAQHRLRPHPNHLYQQPRGCAPRMRTRSSRNLFRVVFAPRADRRRVGVVEISRSRPRSGGAHTRSIRLARIACSLLRPMRSLYADDLAWSAPVFLDPRQMYLILSAAPPSSLLAARASLRGRPSCALLAHAFYTLRTRARRTPR